MEDSKKVYESIRGECDRFLSAYNEDSTMRSSREAFEKILSMLRDFAVEGGVCPSCKKPHPIVRPLYMDVKSDSIMLLTIELRSNVMLLLNKTREEALHDMRDTPHSLPDEVLKAFISIFVVKPLETNLEELVTLNIRPFHIVKWLRHDFDKQEFNLEAASATQEPACA